MEIVASQLDWTTVDEENLAKFLETETGRRFLPRLLDSVPPLLENGKTKQLLIRSGIVIGYQRVARDILAMAHPAARPDDQKEQSSAYPDLRNDAAWNDGLKLEPEKKPETGE